jgi:hypothetical protein
VVGRGRDLGLIWRLVRDAAWPGLVVLVAHALLGELLVDDCNGVLRSNSARKHVPADVREPLIAEADAIGVDTKSLRSKVDCPGAAALAF